MPCSIGAVLLTALCAKNTMSTEPADEQKRQESHNQTHISTEIA